MNEDPNDPRKPIGGLGGGKDSGVWNTPEGDLTIASSVHTGHNEEEDGEERNTSPPTNQAVLSVNDQRAVLQRQMIQWGIASGTSIAGVTVALVPAQIIMAFFVVMSLFVGFSFAVFQRLRLEALDLQRRGVAGYLPDGMVDTLINTSFHDFIVNGNFMEENSFFLLYFIPGLTEDQINGYVDRLVPRHQHVLRRPGMGHFIGPAFMRLLLGEERYVQQQQRIEELPAEEEEDGRPVPRRLELTPAAEVASHLGDDDIPPVEEVAEEQQQQREDATQATQTTVSDFSRFWGTSPPIVGRVFTWTEDNQERSANIPLASRDLVSAINPTEEEDEAAMEAEVIQDAILGSIDAITTGVYDAVSNAAVGFFTGTPLRTGLTATVAAVGVGYFSMWLGGGSSGRMRTPSMPSNPALYSSFLASGATAGIMYFFQIGRSASGPGGNPGSGGGSSSDR